MSDFIIPYQGGERRASILDRIAKALGCSTESLFDPPLCEQGQALEFLRLWSSIENEQDRAKVRDFIRALNNEAATPDEPASIVHAMMKSK